MRRMMDRLFHRYGTKAAIDNGMGTIQVRVFFQSVNSKNWQNMEKVFHPMGWVPRGQYVCLLPADTAVEAGNTLTVARVDYLICRVEDMPVSSTPAYRWALCARKGSEDVWG